jgi:hypothetical protein
MMLQETGFPNASIGITVIVFRTIIHINPKKSENKIHTICISFGILFTKDTRTKSGKYYQQCQCKGG